MKPRRGKLVAILGAALAVGLAVILAASYHDRIYQWWWNRKYGVPVVTTWEELRAQPPIELEGGGTVRLGIEAVSVPAGRGALVYCLADHASTVESVGTPTFRDGSGLSVDLILPEKSPLGPLHVDVSPRDAEREVTDERSFKLERFPEASSYLFARALDMPRPG